MSPEDLQVLKDLVAFMRDERMLVNAITLPSGLRLDGVKLDHGQRQDRPLSDQELERQAQVARSARAKMLGVV